MACSHIRCMHNVTTYMYITLPRTLYSASYSGVMRVRTMTPLITTCVAACLAASWFAVVRARTIQPKSDVSTLLHTLYVTLRSLTLLQRMCEYVLTH